MAIRSPGNHYRLRASDVRAFCEREGRRVPPFVSPPPRRVVTAWSALRGLKLPGVVVEAYEDPYDAILAAARQAAELVVLPASPGRFDATAAVAALRRARGTEETRVIVVDASPARTAALEAAGATRVLRRPARADDVARAIRELLALD